MEQLSVETIGRPGKDILDQVGKIKVQGITSRGVFLETDSDSIIFLSAERFRGPLTLNIPYLENVVDRLKLRSKGMIEHKRIVFPDLSLGFCLSDAEVWEPIGIGEISEKLPLSRFHMIGAVPGSLLEEIIREKPEEIEEGLPFLKEIYQITTRLKYRNFTGAFQVANQILGRGVGLTPEGDDILIGLLYQLRIAANNQNYKLEITEFSQQVCQLAAQVTTKLSSNLLRCAAMGHVDERISNFVHAFYFDPKQLDRRVGELLHWGNTSGRMVLAGIISGMLADIG